MSVVSVDVETADHDAVKVGIIVERVSRVHLSTVDFPDPVEARVVAAQVAVAIHGGMATSATVLI